MIWVEPFAGTLAVWTALHLGRPMPPIAYMGSKRRFAAAILGALRLSPGQGARGLVAADPGPWGRCWSILSTPAGVAAVAQELLAWEGREIRGLWAELVERPLAPGWTDPSAPITPQDVATYLILQGRAAGNVPIYARPAGWRAHQGNGGEDRYEDRVRQTHASRWVGHFGSSGQKEQAAREKGKSHGRIGGLLSPATVARRILHLHLHPWRSFSLHRRADEIPIPRDASEYRVYLDPPYRDCTGYVERPERVEVLRLADRWRSAGAVVAISETVGLSAELGWGHEIRLAPREVLTLSRPPGRQGEQLSLLEVA